MKYIIIVVCMNCEKFIETKDSSLEHLDGELSHGLCKTCYEMMMKEMS